MNDITALTPEKLDEIRQRYSPVAVPKCHICGAEMTIGAATAARVVYACSGATYDDAGCHYAPGRSIADDHYAQSRVTVVDVSDPDVLAVVEELEKAQQAANINNWWKPDVCPITGRRFFMWIEHPDLGYVPTYGGPYDSYTIPTRDDVGEFSCERYDHDFGGWVDDECAGLYVIDEDEICRVHELEQSVAELQEQLRTVELSNSVLESRSITVKLPERYSCDLGYNAPDPNGEMLDRDDVLAMLAAAGIQVTGD